MNDQCEHENTVVATTNAGRDYVVCEDCGRQLDDDGPPDDSWIQATLERAAGVGEPDRSHYDRGRLIRP